jgi:hypothetical protein
MTEKELKLSKEKGVEEWLGLKDELARLEKGRELWHQTICATSRGVFKEETEGEATEHQPKKTCVSRPTNTYIAEKIMLLSVARHLYDGFKFETLHPKPTFGEVLQAIGFHSCQQVTDYFETKKNPKDTQVEWKTHFQRRTGSTC